MRIEDLVGETLNHKKFGDIKVVSVDIDYADLINAKLTMETKDGNLKKFSMRSLPDYFNNLPEDLISDINVIIKTFNKNKLSSVDELIKTPTMTWFNDELSIDDWKTAREFVVSFWWRNSGVDCPVVANNKTVFITGKDACRSIGISENFAGVIYSICNEPHKRALYKGYTWRFATKKDIDNIITQLKNTENE